MNFKTTILVLSIVCSAGTAMGQTTASQKFTVTVPNAISITTPANVQPTHDESDQVFPTQPWVVNSSVGSGAWTVSQATDTTDYINNDGVATVQVSSNGFGRANLDLSVSFVTDGFGSFPAGDYETTVTGTVTAN